LVITEAEAEKAALEYLRRHNPSWKSAVFVNEVVCRGGSFLARGYWSEDHEHLFEVKIDKEGKVLGLTYPSESQCEDAST
jgi:hypothetical protein